MKPSLSTNQSLKTIRDLKIQGKAVFIRVDFNVPLVKNESGEMTVGDDSRILAALPTIRYAVEQGARIVLASHLGRPKGQRKPELSLEPVAHRLAELMGQEVTLAEECMGEGIQLMIHSMKNGQILLLENLRFYTEEEANDNLFAKQLSKLAEVYINDAFGAAHRQHASTYALPSLMLERGIGFLMSQEIRYLEPLLNHPPKPFFALLGGSKVSDKIKAIDSLVRRVDGLLIGGAMAHAFAIAQEKSLPAQAKMPQSQDVEAAKSILKDAQRREIPVYLPMDTHDSFDLGPSTISKFKSVLAEAKTIFWNGPLGWFEKPEYATGTFEIAQAIAEMSAIKIVGGGDTLSAIKQAGVSDQFDHLSTGGGAVLEYLEGKSLPGIEVLKLSARQIQMIQQSLADYE